MKYLIAVLFSLTACIKGFSQDTTAVKRAHIKQLLELTGAAKNGVLMADNLIKTIKTSFPEVPQEFWDSFKSKINGDTIVNLEIPVYEKHFSDAELQGLIAFYSSPLGKSVVAKLPIVMQESYMIGAAWGEKVAKEVVDDLIKKGYSPKN